MNTTSTLLPSQHSRSASVAAYDPSSGSIASSRGGCRPASSAGPRSSSGGISHHGNKPSNGGRGPLPGSKGFHRNHSGPSRQQFRNSSRGGYRSFYGASSRSFSQGSHMAEYMSNTLPDLSTSAVMRPDFRQDQEFQSGFNRDGPLDYYNSRQDFGQDGRPDLLQDPSQFSRDFRHDFSWNNRESRIYFNRYSRQGFNQDSRVDFNQDYQQFYQQGFNFSYPRDSGFPEDANNGLLQEINNGNPHDTNNGFHRNVGSEYQAEFNSEPYLYNSFYFNQRVYKPQEIKPPSYKPEFPKNIVPEDDDNDLPDDSLNYERQLAANAVVATKEVFELYEEMEKQFEKSKTKDLLDLFDESKIEPCVLQNLIALNKDKKLSIWGAQQNALLDVNYSANPFGGNNSPDVSFNEASFMFSPPTTRDKVPLYDRYVPTRLKYPCPNPHCFTCNTFLRRIPPKPW
ncbi:unnamed protein product [Caenorhabditis bovis]|uniref:Uncharacterized protein n=1 Tax=Caenorhabditis bovis TaxID=2654633 RepID=A0A8S1FF94_9PELO|nr:unnamed protein product [Caenorhabditis bovis]